MKSLKSRMIGAAVGGMLVLVALSPAGCAGGPGGGEAAGSEWAFWRGPQYDGSSPETGLVSTWSKEGENLAWSADFIGRSTPVVVDGRVCVIGRLGEEIDRQERVACYDAGSGRMLWEDRFNVYHTTVPFNRVGWASMAADAETGMVYAHGVSGQLIAYDAAGKRVWEHNLAEELGRYSGYGGRTQTPLVEGDLLIINFVNAGWGGLAPLRHRYFAYDKRTGEMIWVSNPGPDNVPYDFNTQSGPVAATINGERLLVAGAADGRVYGLRAATGEKLWEFELSKRALNANVVVHGDKVFASHSEENVDAPTMGRTVCFTAGGEGDITATAEVWRNDISAGFASPAYHEGHLYVVDNSANMYSVDAATGRIEWEYSLGTVGKGSPVVADGKIYATEVNGNFHILKPGPEGAESLDLERIEVPGGRYAEIYGSAAIAYGRVYFTTEAGVFALGQKDRPFEVTRGPLPEPVRKGDGPAVRLQVVPADVVARPGHDVAFSVRALDMAGRPVAAPAGEWSLDGLAGAVTPDGVFSGAASGGPRAGKVVFNAGELAGAASVRFIPDLPWKLDFEEMAPGSTPATWIGASRKFTVVEMEGGKVLNLAPRERGLDRSTAFMGRSDLSGYTIEADIQGTQEGRRRPDIGLINSGYRADLMGAHQKLQVRSWDSDLRMAREVPFEWEMGAWYHMKLRVDGSGGKGLVQVKVWKRGAPEPAEWTLTAEDPHPITGGSPGLMAYAPVNVYWDNIQVTVSE